uniref:Uncharacterized protein n=1 Tax=Knipowitschia caucasica TaxID=637954 RepID=A0AAV2JIE1_KNICA
MLCLKGNDFLEESPYEPVNSRLSDIFRLAPILEGDGLSPEPTGWPFTDPQDQSRNRRAHPNWAILGFGEV